MNFCRHIDGDWLICGSPYSVLGFPAFPLPEQRSEGSLHGAYLLGVNYPFRGLPAVPLLSSWPALMALSSSSCSLPAGLYRVIVTFLFSMLIRCADFKSNCVCLLKWPCHIKVCCLVTTIVWGIFCESLLFGASLSYAFVWCVFSPSTQTQTDKPYFQEVSNDDWAHSLCWLLSELL